jgi:hypothetical protein
MTIRWIVIVIVRYHNEQGTFKDSSAAVVRLWSGPLEVEVKGKLVLQPGGALF